MHLRSLGRSSGLLTAAALVAAAMLGAGSLRAQELAQQVAQRRNGVVRMSFPARDGVCAGGAHYGWGYPYGGPIDYDSDEWDNGCHGETVLVAISVREGKPYSIRTYVGGKWKTGTDSVTDVGAVSGETAARYLLAVAVDSPYVDTHGALYPATLAAGVTLWPDILKIAEDRSRPEMLRRAAIGWIGRGGGDKVTSALESIALSDDDSLQVREAAIHALAARPNDTGTSALIRVVRSGKNSHLRAVALNSLTRTKDPRIAALVQELIESK